MLKISTELCTVYCILVIVSLITSGDCLMGPKLLSISKSRLLLGNPISSAKIALTREDGANDKLAKLLGGLEVYEIPCIMFDTGEDASKLPKAIASHDLILITSPQAAKMFLESWKIAGKPDNLKIATVGDGSSKSLIAEGLIPVFQPSDSTARALAAELPLSLGSTVLYPSSAIAENALLEGLEKRGFVVSLSAVKMRRKMSS
jgi:uroporphyrinogen-III synthase